MFKSTEYARQILSAFTSLINLQKILWFKYNYYSNFKKEEYEAEN